MTPRRHRLSWLLLALPLAACDGGDSTTTDAADGDAPEAAAAGSLQMTWLDDEAVAAGVSFHQIGGTFTAPATLETKVPALARVALTDRAKALGFRRLDDLQFAMRCDETAAPDVACSGEIAAIASR